jgi:chemotaxis protein MotB
MPLRKKKKIDDGPPGQGWLVTFSDCMTLLLCFFVLLLTFSSFEEIKFETLAGAFRSMSNDWFEPTPRLPKESPVEMKRPNKVKEGPMIPTDRDIHQNPPREPIETLDMNIYKDRTVILLPSQRFFWSRGVAMTKEGKRYLHLLARLLRAMDVEVIIAETGRLAGNNLGLRRSWAVMRYFTTIETISPDRFSLGSPSHRARSRFGRQDVLEITLMNIQIEQ